MSFVRIQYIFWIVRTVTGSPTPYCCFKWQTLGGERWDSSKLEIETTYRIMKGALDTTDADDVAVISSLPITHFDKIELKIQTLVNSRVTNVDVREKKGSAFKILLKNRFRKVDKGLPYHSWLPEGWWRELKEQCKINDEDEL